MIMAMGMAFGGNSGATQLLSEVCHEAPSHKQELQFLEELLTFQKAIDVQANRYYQGHYPSKLDLEHGCLTLDVDEKNKLAVKIQLEYLSFLNYPMPFAKDLTEKFIKIPLMLRSYGELSGGMPRYQCEIHELMVSSS